VTGAISSTTIGASGAISGSSLSLTNPLSVANGGTGQSTLASNAILTGNGTTGIIAETTLSYSPRQLLFENGGSAEIKKENLATAGDAMESFSMTGANGLNGAVAGSDGGWLSFKPGKGGNSVTAASGGDGGHIQIGDPGKTYSKGGDSSTGVGGNGGSIWLYAQNGGDTLTGTLGAGGDGGYINIVAGNGGSSYTGGNGGNIQIIAGNCPTSSYTSPIPGSIELRAGLDKLGNNTGKIYLNSDTEISKSLNVAEDIHAEENVIVDGYVEEDYYLSSHLGGIGVDITPPKAKWIIVNWETSTGGTGTAHVDIRLNNFEINNKPFEVNILSDTWIDYPSSIGITFVRAYDGSSNLLTSYSITGSYGTRVRASFKLIWNGKVTPHTLKPKWWVISSQGDYINS
jgi:hypothetical protein